MKERKEEIRAAESEHIETRMKNVHKKRSYYNVMYLKGFPKVPLNSMYLLYSK